MRKRRIAIYRPCICSSFFDCRKNALKGWPCGCRDAALQQTEKVLKQKFPAYGVPRFTESSPMMSMMGSPSSSAFCSSL